MNDVPAAPDDAAVNQRFQRDLAQVRLLIDFISGRKDKSLDALAGVELVDDHGNRAKAETGQPVVEAICRIGLSRAENTIADNARDDALLIVVKDRLNRTAEPACDLTIAFTSMFMQSSATYLNRWEKLKRAVGHGVSMVRGKRWQSGLRNPAPEMFSAGEAHPNLQKQARDFWCAYMSLPLKALTAIVFITWVNWDIHVTTPVLEQIVKAHADYAAAMSDKTFTPTNAACAKPPKESVAVCVRVQDDERKLKASRQGLLEMINQPWWVVPLHPVVFGVRLFNPDLSGAQLSDPVAYIPFIGITLGVIAGFNSIVIPIIFGYLGTVASLLRSISAMVSDRILSPRDYGSFRAAIFVGMVAGLAVGLFFNIGDASVDIGKGAGGTISISAAGLAFLSGFGAAHFFRFLDSLLTRVFPLNPPGDAKAAN